MTTPIAMPTRRILFVDDDPQLLTGLEKALRKRRDRWTMVFADSGDAALAEVRRGAFDVVVSDMRMPTMDGAELLAHIRDHDPTTIRMILSGFSDRNAIVRALPVAHQFFNKPCQLADLSAAIDRACDLRALFGGAALRMVFGALGALPEAPSAYHEIAAMVGRAELGVDALAAVVERDAGLHARVLSTASSAFFGLDRPMRTIAEAVSYLGVDTVVGLVLASHAFALAGDRPLQELSLAGLQHHSLAIARTARERLATTADASDAFIVGLVHDIGRIVIAAALPDAHLAITRQMRQPGARRSAVERGILGTSHGEIAASLIAQWGLPLPIIDALAYHDDDAVAPTPILKALREAHAIHAGPRR